MATPVNKPRLPRSPIPMRSLRYGHPEAHRAFGRDIMYTIILYYILLYRAPRVANGNNHFLLHAAVHPGLHCAEFDGWTLIGCYVTHVTIGCHHAKFVSKFKFVAPQILVNALACARRKCGATNQKNSPDTRLYVNFVWDLVVPLRLVWTHWRSFKTDSQNWHCYSENSRSFCFL